MTIADLERLYDGMEFERMRGRMREAQAEFYGERRRRAMKVAGIVLSATSLAALAALIWSVLR